jgi:hypothetical protein
MAKGDNFFARFLTFADRSLIPAKLIKMTAKK